MNVEIDDGNQMSEHCTGECSRPNTYFISTLNGEITFITIYEETLKIKY